MQRFRGFFDAEVLLGEHLVVVGQPRAGRSDVVAALRRVLEPSSASGRVDPLDVHRPPDLLVDDELPPLTEVEVTLVDLGAGLEQDFFNHVEVLDGDSFLPAVPGVVAPVTGLRLCYRLEYDEVSGVGRHWVDFPGQSDPVTSRWSRASSAQRSLLPFLVVDRQVPLQLRAEGRLRGLMEDADAPATEAAVGNLLAGVRAATDDLSAEPVVRGAVGRVMSSGAAPMLGLAAATAAASVAFVADDGSTAGLLRAVQPALDLGGAGFLPLRSHGSTAAGVLAVAEAAAVSADPSAVVVADDFGDDLDSAAAEYLATVLRERAGQLIVTTRRPEVARAFDDGQLLRLSLHGGLRAQHRLPVTADRKERAIRRQALRDLLTAMNSEIVAVLEGPGDLEGYTAVAERRLAASAHLPPAAYSVRLFAPPGSDGGKSKLVPLARLAASLGFRVRAVIDGDVPGDPVDAATVAELLTVAETVVRLPDRTAVEGPLIDGLPDASVEAALSALDDDFGLGLGLAGKTAAELRTTARDTVKRQNLHRAWVERLPAAHRPPLASDVLDALTGPPSTPVALTQLERPS